MLALTETGSQPGNVELTKHFAGTLLFANLLVLQACNTFVVVPGGTTQIVLVPWERLHITWSISRPFVSMHSSVAVHASKQSSNDCAEVVIGSEIQKHMASIEPVPTILDFILSSPGIRLMTYPEYSPFLNFN